MRILPGRALLLAILLAGCAKGPLPAGDPVQKGHLSLNVVDQGGGKHQLVVQDTRTKRTWVGEDTRREAARLKSATRTESGWKLEVESHTTKDLFSVQIEIISDDGIRFLIDSADRSVPFPELPYPPAFHAELDRGSLLFCNRASGIMLPQTDVWHRNKVLTAYANTDALDMPWVGTLDEAAGDGVLTVLRTPHDGAVRLIPDDNGKLWPQVQWFESKGIFSYVREADVIFVPEGGYVAQALRYRTEAERDGLLSPLRTRTDVPRIDWAGGAAMIWGSPGVANAREYRAHGIRRGILNAHGLIPADEIREITAMGFLCGEYDSYTDFTEGPTGRHLDSVDAAFVNRDGTPNLGWRTPAGIQYYNRSSAMAVRAAKIVIPAVLASYPYTSRFLDVSASLHFIEDYHPERGFDRRGDMQNRQDLFRYVRTLGVVLGGEHPKGWAARFFEYGEGNLSGSFWWHSPKAGNLFRYESKDEIPKEYIDYGINHQIRVPLWDLVFHDTIITTWYWGDSNGFLFNIWPELSDWKDAVNLLHGTPPLIWADHNCYGWNRNRDRFRQSIRNTTHFSERVAFSRLTSHRFLTEDRSVQLSHFEELAGWAVVNLVAEPRTVEVEGRSIALAPYGFHAEAAGLVQSRVADGEGITTTIEATDYFFRDSSANGTTGPITGAGRVELFRLSDTRWHVLLKTSGETQIQLAELGIEGNGFRVSEITPAGRLKAPAASAFTDRILRLPASGAQEKLLAIDIEANPLALLSYPDAGAVAAGTLLELHAGTGAKRISYTLDGSDPAAATALPYDKALPLVRGTKLRAIALDEAGASGPEFAATFRVERPLYDSAKVTAANSPHAFSVPLDGADRLVLNVTDAEDGLDFDTCHIVNLRLFRADGTSLSLSSLTPVSAVQSSLKPVFDGPHMNIGTTNYKEGIQTHPMATMVWQLPEVFVRLEGAIGTDGGNEGRGSVRLIVSGSN